MPCSICKSQNEEQKICIKCLDFLKSLKCENCSESINFQEKNFCVFCNVCKENDKYNNQNELDETDISEDKNKYKKKTKKQFKERARQLEKELEKLKNNKQYDLSKQKELEQKLEKELKQLSLLNDKPIYDDKNLIEFYDIILKINSIRDILKGWEIEFNENGKQHYEAMKTKDFLKVGVVGLGNKGKSFLLQKLANIELPSGTSIKTEGLSIKCLDINSENQNIILIDSAGSETPLIEDSNFDFNKLKDKREDLREQLDNLARDKCLTETFLQSIIIQESNMLLILVGILSYPDQKLLNKITTQVKNRKQNLYVIHNLQTFTEINQVEHYIEETLFKSATFRLKKRVEIKVKDNDDEDEKNSNQNDCYFIEQNLNSENNEENNNIFHLIMARDHTPAGDFYNNFVIKFLRNQMNNYPKQSSFNIVQKIKDYFFLCSKDYLEDPLLENSFEESEDIIKLKKDSEKDLKLKKVLVDEMGISNFIGNSYSPKICYFIFKDKFYFQIELPGNFDKKFFKYNIIPLDKFYVFDIKANKIIGSKDFFPKNMSDRKFKNTREEGQFHLRFNVLAEDFQFKELKIKQVKAPKNKVDKHKVEAQNNNNSKECKNEIQKDKILEIDEIKSEEGVLTFYVELQITKPEEKGLSDSEDDQ